MLVGIDAFLDMGRTMTNVIGNGVATAVVAKWENELGAPVENDATFMPPIGGVAPSGPSVAAQGASA